MDLQCITDKTTIYKEIKQKVKKKITNMGKERKENCLFKLSHCSKHIL